MVTRQGWRPRNALASVSLVSTAHLVVPIPPPMLVEEVMSIAPMAPLIPLKSTLAFIPFTQELMSNYVFWLMLAMRLVQLKHYVSLAITVKVESSINALKVPMAPHMVYPMFPSACHAKLAITAPVILALVV